MRKLYTLVIFIYLISLSAVSNAYINRYSTITNGSILFTGNTLGLSKVANQNNPGINDAIGAFTTTIDQIGNPMESASTYPNSTDINEFADTVLDWKINSSSAFLDLPVGSTVLYAELIWMGGYGWGDLAPEIPRSAMPFLPDVTAVELRTPDGVLHSIMPDILTKQEAITPGFTTPPKGNYVRSANVTSIIQAGGGAGKYIVGHVPAAVAPDDETHNAAGWTLAVFYSNPGMITSALTMFVGAEQASNSQKALISGFCTPATGTANGRLFLSSIEGDHVKNGDSFLFGPTSSLSPSNALLGANNSINNFFASQINTKLTLVNDIATGKLLPSTSATLDMRGSYGLKNFPTGNSPDFGRQGIDITTVDITSHLAPSQTMAYTQGTTSSDDYTVSGIGVQIQVSAPVLKLEKKVNNQFAILSTFGATVTFSGTITNEGQETATNIVIKDLLQTGLTLVPGTSKINNMSVADFNLVSGYNYGSNLAPAQSFNFEFMATVADPNPAIKYVNSFTADYKFIPCNTYELGFTAVSNVVEINFLCQSNAPCSDGNACTMTDTCVNGVCLGTNPVICSATDQCHSVGTCNTTNGFCDNPTVVNGTSCGNTRDTVCDNPNTCLDGVCQNNFESEITPCNDGNACTMTDSCSNGECQGSNPLICQASDQCHSEGACDPSDGSCSDPIAQNGTSCGNTSDTICDNPDTCLNGECVDNFDIENTPCLDNIFCNGAESCDGLGACQDRIDPCSTCMLNCDEDNDMCFSDERCIVCGNGTSDAGEQCDDGNINPGDGCSPTCLLELAGCSGNGDCDDEDDCTTDICESGSCTNSIACNDGNACTLVDSCSNGVCQGSNPLICQAIDQCHSEGTCDPSSGSCNYPIVENGTICGNPSDTTCDNPNTCLAGICQDNFESENTPCSDTVFCNGEETCDGLGTCLKRDDPCPPCMLNCDEDNDECFIADNCIICGDSTLDEGEQCDDGNLSGLDGCSATCFLEFLRCSSDDDCDDDNNCTLNICESGACTYVTDSSKVCDVNSGGGGGGGSGGGGSIFATTISDPCPLISNYWLYSDEDLKDIDLDFDRRANDCDNCPTIKNIWQEDQDLDGVGDVCDNCPTVYNPDQADINNNGIGDVCEDVQVSNEQHSIAARAADSHIEAAPKTEQTSFSCNTTGPQDLWLILAIMKLMRVLQRRRKLVF